MEDANRMDTHVKVRVSQSQLAEIRRHAEAAGMTVSALIRARAVHAPVVPRSDGDTAGSIDQLGRLLKHLYPKDKGWATADDRRRWWRLVEELRETARMLRRRSG